MQLLSVFGLTNWLCFVPMDDLAFFRLLKIAAFGLERSLNGDSQQATSSLVSREIFSRPDDPHDRWQTLRMVRFGRNQI